MSKLTPYQDKALNYEHHISVTANAGSGKTFVLSKRYLNIALNEDVALKNIVAITFTEKAASELYKKIASEIEEQISITISENEKRKLELLRRQLVSANISTIHSFCINVLKEFSPEAGIDAAFSPIDQITSEELIDLSIEEVFDSFVHENELTEKLMQLIRVFGSKKALVSILKSMINNRKVVTEIVNNIYSKSVSEIVDFFNGKFETEFEDIFGNDIPRVVEALSEINSIVLQNAKNIDVANEAANFLRQLENTNSITDKLLALNEIKYNILTGSKLTVRSRGYLSANMKKGREETVAIIEQFFNSIKPFQIPKDYNTAHKALANIGLQLVEAFQAAIELYESRKYAKAFLDFEDILLHTEKLLQSKDVRQSLREKYKYIMIDEFQDTNELQYNIFMPILENLKIGNLFIVGDQKQSIYRFRGAEPEIFDKTKSKIKQEGNVNSDLELPHSFRVAPIIAAFVNVVFSELFKFPNPKYNEVEYSSLICARDQNEFGEINFLIADSTIDDIDEKELIARKIIELSNDGVELGNIAVLCRKRKLFFELEEVFIKHGILYTIAGGKGFYQRQIISDLHNYISFLLNQKDDLAFVGILRSPFYSLADSTIFEVSLCNGLNFYEKFCNYAKDNNVAQKIVLLVNEHIKMASRVEFPKLIRKILLDTYYWNIIAARRDAIQELANLEKIIVIASSFANQGFKTLFDFKEYLRDAIINLGDEGQALLGVEDNSVKVMTIHQSKGLEFDTLFLFGCNERSMDDKVKSGSIAVDKDLGILTKVSQDNGYFEKAVSPPITGLHNYVITKKDEAEIKRLLYVAITRAVNRLFICASAKENKFENGSFINLIQKGLNFNFSDNYRHAYSQPFMKDAKNNFEVFNAEVDLSIQVLHDCELGELSFESNETEISNPKFLTKNIIDVEKEEIISATKIATFTQCPVKYQLTYEFGYSKFINLLDNKIELYAKDYRSDSDESSEIAGDVRGRIIHAVLEENISNENLSESVYEKLKKENYNVSLHDKTALQIISDLQSFYGTEIYKKLTRAKKFYNEFEIYTKYKDYYLFGIVDKLIIEQDKLTIVDYKSDQIREDQIDDRAQNYFPQLKFYCYALSKHFPNISQFKIMLLFLSVPEKQVSLSITQQEIKEYGKYIESVVESIRNNIFKPNLEHCRKCHFYKGNSCIKNIS